MTRPKTLQEYIEDCFNTRDLPTVLASNVSTLLKKACAPNQPCDSGGTNWKEGAVAYELATWRLREGGLFTIADSILREWWRELNERQQKERRWFPYAIPTYLLCQVFLSVGDLGMAFRWAILSYAHDILSNQYTGGAHQILHATFGMSTRDTALFTAVGEECRKDIETNQNDWGRLCGFPEEVVRKFITNEGQNPYAVHIAHHNTKSDFPISTGYLTAMITELNATTADEKGKRLEAVAFYLMSLLPGCVPRRDVLDRERAFETDLLIRNLYVSSNIVSDLFGRHILVECKNYDEPVGVAHVGYFLFRMRLTHALFGVIFAPKGITGEDDEAARTLIRRAFHEDNSVCIVIDLNDLKRLAKEGLSLYWLLLEKYEEFRFGRPKRVK